MYEDSQNFKPREVSEKLQNTGRVDFNKPLQGARVREFLSRVICFQTRRPWREILHLAYWPSSGTY